MYYTATTMAAKPDTKCTVAFMTFKHSTEQSDGLPLSQAVSSRISLFLLLSVANVYSFWHHHVDFSTFVDQSLQMFLQQDSFLGCMLRG